MPCTTPTGPKYVPLYRIAAKLGLPLARLQAFAEDGQIPAMKLGRRWMANLAAVEQSLLERCGNEAMTHGQGGGS